MGAPTVQANDRTILLGNMIVASDLYFASDPDNDPITQVRFRDLNGGSGSGFFTFNGLVQPANVNLTYNIGDIGNLLYNAGTAIGSETIQVAVKAGGEWSAFTDFVMYSVVANLRRPILSAPDLVVVQNETLRVAEFVSYSDPDGWPVKRYRIRDRNPGINSGYFQLNGAKLDALVWHYVNPGDWENLKFVAAKSAPNNDRLDFRAYDSDLWSFRITVDGTTTINANRPVVIPDEVVVGPRERIPMRDLFAFTDADGNTAKAFRFLDTSPHGFSGFMERNGIPQPSKVFIQVPANELDTLEWVAANKSFDELVRVQVFDGRHLSDIATIRVQSRPKPLLLGVDEDTVVINELERVAATELFTKVDNGPAYTRYQVYDDNPEILSAEFAIGATSYSANTVHEFTPLEYSNLEVQGGLIDQVSRDGMYVRAFNGLFWGDWTRLNVRTEPYHIEALAVSSWAPFLPQTTEKFTITYSFMQAFPEYPSGAADEASFIRPWNTPEFDTFDSPKAAMRRVFQVYEEFANFDFVEVPDSSINPQGGQGGTIRLGTYCQAATGVIAYAFFPNPEENGGDIWLNRAWSGGPDLGAAPRGSDFLECEFQVEDNFDEGPGIGGLIFTALIHELGHSLGLKHTDTPFPTTSPLAQTPLNSIMQSFVQERPDSFPPGIYAQTPMLYDVAALQSIYGANETFNNTDTVYDLNYWSDNNGIDRLEVIWDTGGIDTIDMSGTSLASNTIDLRQGNFSSLAGIETNIGITFGTVIENAIGGDLPDVIFGNESDNVLIGGNGPDVIQYFGGSDLATGGRGNDTFLTQMGDGNNRINENRLAGRDRIEVGLFLGLDNFADDMSFSRFGNDLLIDFTIDRGLSRGTILVENHRWGGSRVETLEVMGTDVDLQYLFDNIGMPGQRFSITNTPGKYGFLVAPVT